MRKIYGFFMMIQEAKWFQTQLEKIEAQQMHPMCNVGSSTGSFRKQQQPWIDQLIFSPLEAVGVSVKHLDLKQAQGVDIVGDLCDEQFLKTLLGAQFKSVFCSNLLEHLASRDKICKAMVAIVPPGGYFFISVPYSYPYHPDPIDTRFRPSTTELASLFAGTRIVCSEVVRGDSLLWARRHNPLIFFFTLFRCLVPFYKPVSWWRNKGYLPWFFRPLTASCVILQKL
jgi:SAM-dependent methyltransferase